MTAALSLVPFKKLDALACEGCGATVDARCNCGLPYLPIKPRAAASKAIEAHPDWSDRKLAVHVGVSDKTVGAARKTTAEASAVDRRTGIDGKTRKWRARRDRTERANLESALNEAGITPENMINTTPCGCSSWRPADFPKKADVVYEQTIAPNEYVPPNPKINAAVTKYVSIAIDAEREFQEILANAVIGEEHCQTYIYNLLQCVEAYQRIIEALEERERRADR